MVQQGCAQVLGGVAALLVGALVVEPPAADLAHLVGAGKRHCPNTRSLSICSDLELETVRRRSGTLFASLLRDL